MLVDIGEELKREQVLLGDDVTPEGERRERETSGCALCYYCVMHRNEGKDGVSCCNESRSDSVG